jgi:hypothetical protein
MMNYKNLTPYKMNLLVWASFFVVAMIFYFSALYFTKWILVLVPVFLVGGSLFINSIVCPNCGTPVNYPRSFFGIRVPSGIFGKKCIKCGWDLDK